MIKLVEALVILVVIIFAFFMGVKYSDQVKSQASWIFDSKPDEEVEMPDLSNQNDNNINQNVDENGNDLDVQQNIDSDQIAPTQDNEQDNQEINHTDSRATNPDSANKK
jgi:hypothetical protein